MEVKELIESEVEEWTDGDRCGGSRGDVGVARMQHGRPRQSRGDTENMGLTISCAKVLDRGNIEDTDARKAAEIDVGKGTSRGRRE